MLNRPDTVWRLERALPGDAPMRTVSFLREPGYIFWTPVKRRRAAERT